MERYIEQSSFPLKKRISEHKGYINSKFPTQATGDFFYLTGHSLKNFTDTVIEKVKKNNECCRKKKRNDTHQKYQQLF